MHTHTHTHTNTPTHKCTNTHTNTQTRTHKHTHTHTYTHSALPDLLQIKSGPFLWWWNEPDTKHVFLVPRRRHLAFWPPPSWHQKGRSLVQANVEWDTWSIDFYTTRGVAPWWSIERMQIYYRNRWLLYNQRSHHFNWEHNLSSFLSSSHLQRETLCNDLKIMNVEKLDPCLLQQQKLAQSFPRGGI